MNDIWAVTAYFNPAGYVRRLMNYRVFRAHLTVPLIAVELAYGRDFELTSDDADVLIQLRGNDVMWQKERLLNIALQALPPECRKVVWMDCDVIFGSDAWAANTGRRLDDIAVLQPFSRVHYLPQDWRPEELRPSAAESTRPSVAWAITSGVPAKEWLTDPERRRRPPGLGLAWAARRETLERHGLYDACIVGGGDRAILCAADGCIGELMDDQHMNQAQRQSYLAWANPFHEEVRSAQAYVEGDLYHLWHGDHRHRSYRSRHGGLQQFEFDPFADIALTAEGLWRWNSEKPELHAFVSNYFISRREDG